MLYFPDVYVEYRFRLFCIPLPPKLLPWLIDRGLNIIVLPEDQKRAEELTYSVLRIPREPLPHLKNVLPHEQAHYRPATKTIILPAVYLDRPKHNVVIHEIGHALDYLYWDNGYLLSDVEKITNVLRKVPPLDRHCKEQDEAKNDNAEQFASSFEAFFNDKNPRMKTNEFYHTVHDIDEGFIKLMNRYFVNPFMDSNKNTDYEEKQTNVQKR